MSDERVSTLKQVLDYAGVENQEAWIEREKNGDLNGQCLEICWLLGSLKRGFYENRDNPNWLNESAKRISERVSRRRRSATQTEHAYISLSESNADPTALSKVIFQAQLDMLMQVVSSIHDGRDSVQNIHVEDKWISFAFGDFDEKYDPVNPTLYCADLAHLLWEFLEMEEDT
ncbi:MAG: hypothetical protein JJ921_12725 [Pseudomonadales bacterium]|nr:hypothetical protein [Pseudomonadales bacterium]MBO6598018.1 hypothetical protein [Pseudomonadales bacterium]MBO6703192.1 hypothetical protein [Pseudomonadales bacterium]MBO6824528.1 hypothetical protein [Pseudomonadales bacterium]MBO7006197.1 hypothetical protein [Pseudomonadales bacterium]